jgi:hypothetical protein
MSRPIAVDVDNQTTTRGPGNGDQWRIINSVIGRQRQGH